MKKFEMKKLAALVMAAVMMTAFAAGAFAAQKITLNEAKQIALRHAGLKASQVRFTEAHAERDDGRKVYDIEFRRGAVKYEFEIDAVTGRIRDCDVDYHDYD